MFQSKESKLKKISKCFCEQCDCIILIHMVEEEYELITADALLSELIPETGTCEELYESLFFKFKEKEVKVNEVYACFTNKDVFKEENYIGYIQLHHNGIEKSYDFRILRMSEDTNAVFLFENSNANYLNDEQMKFEGIQENFLYTMLVDLTNDSCKNPQITEMANDRHDFISIKYSQWRIMLSNTFMDADREVFLRISDPAYLLNYFLDHNELIYECKMKNMQGIFIWVRLKFQRVNGFSTDHPLFVYTVQDIDEDMERLLKQRNIIEVVEKQNAKLMQENKAKTGFVADMSHELRTPLNAIMGMSQILMQESNDEQVFAKARTIQNAGRMLLEVINNILDYSKLEAGKMEIVPVTYSPAEWMQNLADIISLSATAKGLEFSTHLGELVPDNLIGDDKRLQQVAMNLLTNAVKYTQTGRVDFIVDFEQKSAQTGLLKVSVKDTGIGMKKEDMAHLFDDFVRFDVSKNRNVEGTGLGMGIVNRTLQQMGSELKVASVYGQGSCFSFVVEQEMCASIKQDETNEKRIEKEQTKDHLHVLVVDDIDTNRMLAKLFLQRAGYVVKVAESGALCLKMLQEEAFDLVLLDHLMPDMDGIETLAQIRKLKEPMAHIPVIVLTANSDTNACEYYKQAGFDGYLEKPIVLEKMIKEIEHVRKK